MAKYSQSGRPLTISTPLGTDVLLLNSFHGTEALSQLFRFEVDTLSENTAVDPSKILGQKVTLQLLIEGSSPRYLNGIVIQFSQLGQTKSIQGNEMFTGYRLLVVPEFWLLTQKIQSRMFQQMAVPDILKKVLTGLDVSYSLQGKYQPRDYCVQYRESDFAFASRLMEDEGIYYYFKHTSSGHQMVVADTPQGHVDVPAPTTASLLRVEGGKKAGDWVREFDLGQALRSNKITLWDYCFEVPDKHLDATKTAKAPKDAEYYDYPGGYAKRFDGVDPGGSARSADVNKIFDERTRVVELRLDEQTAATQVITGRSTCRNFTSGQKFTLQGHFNGSANGAYVFTEVTHQASMGSTYVSSDQDGYSYENTFHCLPAKVPFRPLRTTPRPVIAGTQTAVVVGPKGQEIFPDKYGRVKVQFPWDREGKLDANSSCWIRVGSPWAGQQWGMIHIPRIGQEVIVAFEEGDPDQPIIVGSVYNAANMPPYVLPDNMTQSTLKSRSTLKGTAENFNELRFEDKKGNEQIYFHAEKNYDRVVENNDTLQVGSNKADDGSQTIEIWNNRTETIKEGNESITIEKGNRTETIKQGDESITLEKGSRTTSIKTDDTLTVQGKRTLTITGDQTLTVKSGNRSVKVSAGTDALEAATSITLKVGGNSIVIDTSGITIKGTLITIQASGALALKGATVTIN